MLRWTMRGQYTGAMPGVPHGPHGGTARCIYQVVGGNIRANHEWTEVAQVLAGLKVGK